MNIIGTDRKQIYNLYCGSKLGSVDFERMAENY